MIIPSLRRVRGEVADSWVKWLDLPSTGHPHGPTIHLIGDRFYLAVGDWDANTGPVNVMSIGFDGRVKTHLTGVMTEAIELYREFDGAIYGPLADPRGSDFGGYVTNAGGTWRTVATVPNMVHTFDVLVHEGAVWLAGSRRSVGGGSYAMVVRSDDGGVTWDEVYLDPPETTGVQRMFGIHAEGGAVHAWSSSRAIKTLDGGATWVTSEINRSADYLAPEMYRKINPTSDEQRFIQWRAPVREPVTQSWACHADGYAYSPGKSESGYAIYRRPGPRSRW